MKRRVYSGRILSLDVYDVEVAGRQVKREIISHGGAAAVIGFDQDGRIILVRQERFPHGMVLEIPAGTIERGESPVECAHREMQEETGYRAEKMSHLLSYYPSIGYNTEVIHCYVASGLARAPGTGQDAEESITIERMEPGRLIGMIKAGKIQDSKTICAVLTYAARNGMLS